MNAWQTSSRFKIVNMSGINMRTDFRSSRLDLNAIAFISIRIHMLMLIMLHVYTSSSTSSHASFYEDDA